MSLESEKARLRSEALSARCALDPELAMQAAQQAAQHVAGSPEFGRAERIALYASAGSEISTLPVFQAARRERKGCLFPRCRAEGELEFAQIDEWDQLAVGRYGILEPEAALPAAPPGIRDLVLVPGLAFDRFGGRLGRGGGYYDRAFSHTTAPGPFLMGFAYAIQFYDAVPVGGHDRMLDAVVTELGIVRPA